MLAAHLWYDLEVDPEVKVPVQVQVQVQYKAKLFLQSWDVIT